MDDHQLKSLIEALDASCSRDGAVVRLHQYGGGPDEGQIIANREGYLRFGIELMKAAIAPAKDDQNDAAIPVDLSYLITSDSMINFDWFERRDLDQISRPDPRNIVGTIVGIVMMLILLAVGGLALIGLVAVIMSFSK